MFKNIKQKDLIIYLIKRIVVSRLNYYEVVLKMKLYLAETNYNY